MIITPNEDESKYIKYKRFEKIDRIIYGHIEYPPLLYYKRSEPNGIGVKLLEKIFEGKIDKERKINWNEIETALPERSVPTKYSIDLIATPLFETKDRSKKLLFCSPIFFSEVGIYINSKGKLNKHINGKLSFSGAIELIKKFSPELRAAYIEGEISEKMVNKYFKNDKPYESIPEHKIKRFLIKSVEISDLIKAVDKAVDNGNIEPIDINSNVVSDIASDFVFAETYQANNTEAVRSKSVINILYPKELLYPVSFAVRKEEYILKNYINLKLLELDSNTPYGILGIIADVIASSDNRDDLFAERIKKIKSANINEQTKKRVEVIKEYFIRDYELNK